MVLTELVFPTRCAGCGTPGASPCAACVTRLHPLGEVAVVGVDRCFALLDYDDVARRLIAKLKYGGVRTGVAWFAESMAARVADAGEPVDLVTWVPAVARNKRRRGFDQSEALARPIARRLGVAAHATLRRRGTVGQTGLDRRHRLRGPDIELRGVERRVRGRRVLLVDDVLTTGATLRSAAQTLHSASPAALLAVVAAHRRSAGADAW